MKLQLFLILIFIIFQSECLAQTLVKFTNAELNAVVVLMKPELSSLELNDQSGVFSPGPSLRAIGIDDLKFDINFSGLSELANIHFDHLKGLAPSLKFEGGQLVLIVPIEDRQRAARSAVGSINVKGVVLKSRLGWRSRTDGTPELYVMGTEVNGSLTGTGVLRPGFMIGLIKKLLIRTIGAQTESLLARGVVQDAVQSGLLVWSRFSTGHVWHSIVPGSPSFYDENGDSGFRYLVQ